MFFQIFFLRFLLFSHLLLVKYFKRYSLCWVMDEGITRNKSTLGYCLIRALICRNALVLGVQPPEQHQKTWLGNWMDDEGVLHALSE
jgi:hypothetical protein